MILSTQMQDRLKQSLADSPLLDGEVRRVDGMGELYFSQTKEQNEEYYFKYSLSIDAVPYYFFGKV